MNNLFHGLTRTARGTGMKTKIEGVELEMIDRDLISERRVIREVKNFIDSEVIISSDGSWEMK